MFNLYFMGYGLVPDNHHRDFNFLNDKKGIFCIFYQVNNLFLHQSYLKSQLPVKLTWSKM